MEASEGQQSRFWPNIPPCFYRFFVVCRHRCRSTPPALVARLFSDLLSDLLFSSNLRLRNFWDVEGTGRVLRDHAEKVRLPRRSLSLGRLQIGLNKARLCGSIRLRSETEGVNGEVFPSREHPARGANPSSPRQVAFVF
jgi:hypothetical protein